MFQEARIKSKMLKFVFFKSQIEYLGHLVSGQGLSLVKQNVQAIMDLVPASNITEACHKIGLISCYRKVFPVFNDMVQLFNELTKINVAFKWKINLKESRLCETGHNQWSYISIS